MKFSLSVFFLSFVLSGCVSNLEEYKTKEHITEDSAYIAGNFEDTTHYGFGFLTGSTSNVFIRNLKERKTYRIDFQLDNNLVVYKLPPGEYEVELIFKNNDNLTINGSTIFKLPKRLKQPFKLEPNTVFYLGSFKVYPKGFRFLFIDKTQDFLEYEYDLDRGRSNILKKYNNIDSKMIIGFEDIN